MKDVCIVLIRTAGILGVTYMVVHSMDSMIKKVLG